MIGECGVEVVSVKRYLMTQGPLTIKVTTKQVVSTKTPSHHPRDGGLAHAFGDGRRFNHSPTTRDMPTSSLRNPMASQKPVALSVNRLT